MIGEEEIGETRGLTEIADVLVKAAKDTCGVHSEKVDNPSIKGHEDEQAEIRRDINKWWVARRSVTNPITTRVKQQIKLKRSRKQMKKQIQALERVVERTHRGQWRGSQEGDLGAMYNLLRKLGTRNSKPQTGHKITTELLKDHFSKISEKFENLTQDLQKSVEQTPDRSNDIALIAANRELNQTPSTWQLLDRGGSER